MILEVMIGALLITAYQKAGKKGILTKDREEVWKSALENLTDPEALRTLATEYEKQGLDIEATMLRKRADLRSLSKEKKRAYEKALQKGLASDDIEKVEALADAFEEMTATGSAIRLRKHAADLRSAKEIQVEPSEFADKEEVKEEQKEESEVPDVKAELVEEKKDEAPKEHATRGKRNGRSVTAID